MTRKGAISAVLGLTLALAAAGWLAGLLAFAQSAALMAPPPAPLPKRDAIVVLTGGSNRLDAGFDLLEKGLGRKLFISGVYRGTEIRELLRRWKDEPQSSLDCCVVLGFEAGNTSGNAIETIAWLRKENFRSIYLVTANYHIRRALLEFGSLAPELDIAPWPVAPEKLDLGHWWQSPASRGLILREYAKYVAASVLHAFGSLS